MNELNLDRKIEPNNIIDPITIINKYIAFSTFHNDVIFSNGDLIFCGGIIKTLGKNVYNLNEKDFVGYISFNDDSPFIISSNLVFKLNESNLPLIFILPYASYALKILRLMNPKLGQNIIIIGYNFFSVLLFKLFKLTGANIYLIRSKQEQNEIDFYDINVKIELDNLSEFMKKIQINKILINYKVNKVIIEILTENNDKIINKHVYSTIRYYENEFKDTNFKLEYISTLDVGLSDPNYNRGVKYPYPFIRWDYKRNLKYFISLIENNIINLDFINIKYIEIDSVNNLIEMLEKLEENHLFLFKIKTKKD